MIDRETVLHVARLARLELSDDEVERMIGELAGVLEHIETIAQLDLEGVAPTSHVVERAARPRRWLCRPQPAGVSPDALELTASQAAAAIARGDLDPVELFDLYRERAAADTLGAFTWVADAAPPAAGGPLGGVPVAVKDLFCTEGVPSQAGSRILEGYRPPYTATGVANLLDAGATLLGTTNQDEFAMGSSSENSAFG